MCLPYSHITPGHTLVVAGMPELYNQETIFLIQTFHWSGAGNFSSPTGSESAGLRMPVQR